MRSRPTHSRCVRCGAPAAPRQEICLQCGARLPDSGPSAFELTLRRRAPWLPLELLVPMVVLALVTLASAAVALGARHERQASAPTLLEPTTAPAIQRTPTRPASTGPVSTGSVSAAGPTISTGTLPVAPGAPSSAARTTPSPPTTHTTATRPATTRARPSVSVSGSWPRHASGWTVVIESLPASQLGHSEALATIRRARRAGLAQVGVLLSSRYSTLRNGYWAVYTGVFATSAAAEAAAATAARRGFPGAYPARVAP